MRNTGFSTGALAKGDFLEALKMLAPFTLGCLELSALRIAEVKPLVDSLPSLDLKGYSHISFHTPSQFTATDEVWLADLLFEKIPKSWTIVLHPDAIVDFAEWTRFGSRLAIENMDRRKSCGRSVAELRSIFTHLPDASLCFDIGHARQFDSSMTEAFLILTIFAGRLVQIHASEVNSESQHDPISYGAKLAFKQVAELIPASIPVIIESRVKKSKIAAEIANVNEALTPNGLQSKANELHEVFEGLESLVVTLGQLNVH